MVWKRAAPRPGFKGFKGGIRVLKMDGPSAQGFLSLTALRAEGCGLPLCGNAYKVSVTGLAFSIIWHDRHSAVISHLRWLFPPLVPYGTTFPPRWEACHLILSRLRLLANQVPLPPQAGALWMLSHGAMSLQESIERFILSPGWGESPAQPDKGEPRSG